MPQNKKGGRTAAVCKILGAQREEVRNVCMTVVEWMSDEFVGVLTKNKAAFKTLEQELCAVSCFLFENPTVIQEAESREEAQEKKTTKKKQRNNKN